MNKNYIIWGISDKGYEDNISSSFPNKIIPAEFKASVSDSHRQYAFAFARENPNDHYFYSIEQVGSDVLYTIYRTNFKGGSVGNRLAYDAATIIISKNHIIEKPLNSLKLLISSYITQKDSGFGNFNFENALAGIRLLANNDKRSISKRYKAGYIKYHSETELSSVLVDKKDKLHNFNKVYFFTRLNLLEQGENKIQDLKDYKAIPIKIINFDARYYRIFVENNEVNTFGNTFNAYEGDEIKIYKAKGNTPQNVELAKTGLTITLKKIEPPKPKPQLTNQDIWKKRKRKEQMQKYVVLAVCFVLILGISGFLLEDNIKGWLNPRPSASWECENGSCVDPGTGNGAYSSLTDCQSSCVAAVNYEVEFTGEFFIKLGPDSSERDTITDADTLLARFQESIYFKDDATSYKLHFTHDDWKIINEKEEKLTLGTLGYLKVMIEKAPDKDLTRKILDHIHKVRNYQKLTEGKLEFNNKFWKIDKDILWSKKGNKDFTKYTEKINIKLKEILKDNLPKDIFEAIFSNSIELKNTKKVNKTHTKPISQKPKPKVSPTVKTCEVIVHKDNLYWGRTSFNLEKWSTKIGKAPEYATLTKEASDIIRAYENCGCSKCKKELEDRNLKTAKEFIEDSK